MIHALKIEPNFYEEIRNGDKQFEVREDDRHYSVGDVLALNELDDTRTEYTGRALLTKVTCVLRDERFLQKNYVVMGIKLLGVTEEHSQGVKFEIYGGNGK
nr:MAG TPA: activating signal cointegrator [Caudoviricetes sp.]